MNDAILTFHDFGVSYGRKCVLEHIETAIRPHRITAIIGPSGCGKSTLLKAMNRMLELENGAELSGSIHFQGKDLQTIPPEELRRRIGMVFQTPTPFPMSVYKNLTYAPRYYGVRDKIELDKIVQETLETTGLFDEVKGDLHRSALTLSGGQQQRLCIARALTVKPEVLLLDEPCSALDVKSTQTIEQLLLHLKEQYTVVIVTHNLFQARRIADDCLFLLNGQLWEQGTAEALFSHPQRPETRDYVEGIFA